MLGQDEIKIYSKAGKMLIGSLVFVVLGVFLIYTGIRDRTYVVVFVGLVCTLFFGAALMFALSKVLLRKPALVIGDEEIVDRSSAASVGEIKWSEIKGIDIYQTMKEQFIGIEVHHPEQIIARQPGWKKKLIELNSGMTGATIHLSASGLSCNLNELYLQLYRRWKMSKSNGSGAVMQEGGRDEELQA